MALMIGGPGGGTDVRAAAGAKNDTKGEFSTAPARPLPTTRHRFDEELAQLEARLCAMGEAAAGMLEDAARALTHGDAALAQSVVDRDAHIDELDRAVEEGALLLVARQQPVASDLRLLGAALKITTDIERIGDHAVNIARVALRLKAAGLDYAPLVDLPRMAQIAVGMVRTVTGSLADHDLAAARAVIRRDDELDVLYKEAQRELRAAMQQAEGTGVGGAAAVPAPRCVLLASHLLFVAHYLERIGDHCTSIAERVEYQETGRAPRTRAAVVASAGAGSAFEDDLA
jgi:phosphate transport system protein